MRILFDALAAGSRPSGTTTRLLGLLPALVRLGGLEIAVLSGPWLEGEARRRLGNTRVLVEPRPPRSPIGRLVRERFSLRRALRAFPADVVVAEALPWPPVAGLVGVVHDLRHLKGGGFRRWVSPAVLRSGIRKAVAVHAVSHSVANELKAVAPRSAPKLSVVPNGVDLLTFRCEAAPGDAAVLARRGLAPGYLLCVGHLERRKDPWTALYVRRELALRGLDVPLVFVGKGEILPEGDLAALRAEFRTQRPGAVLRDVDGGELPVLYRHAALLLAPAREEGFGLALLEAAACGLPVVASAIPAHIEILGDGALYARPGEVSAFVSRTLAILERHVDVEDLKLRAAARAEAYSWESAAGAFVRSFESCSQAARRHAR